MPVLDWTLPGESEQRLPGYDCHERIRFLTCCFTTNIETLMILNIDLEFLIKIKVDNFR